MKIKLFSTSKPLNPSVDGMLKQVYAGKDWVYDLVNKISTGSILSIMGPDLKGELTHICAPKIKRNCEGAAAEIAGNASNVKGEFSLRYITLKDIGFFCRPKRDRSSAAEGHTVGRNV